MFRVKVELIEGKELVAADETGFSDPYCTIQIGKAYQAASSHVLQSLNPIWDQKFEFSPVNLRTDNTMRISVFDKDDFNQKVSSKDQAIGWCEVALETLKEGKLYHVWLPLQNAASGKIRIKLEVQILADMKLGKDLASSIVEECKKTSKLFEDPDFPASEAALFKDPKKKVSYKVEWRRPSEIAPNPQMFVGGAESGDVIQGYLGDCYLLGALSCVATRDDLLKPIIVSENPKLGFYQFKFFKNGEWKVVTIDDRLPCLAGTKNLIYGHCKDKNEMWVPLIEKAYAKLHGCYENIESGSTASALTDLTGEGNQIFDFSDKKVAAMIQTGELWKLMNYFASEGFLMGTAFHNATGPAESDTGKGILQNHAYGLLKCIEPEPGVRLINIRNPWGKGEWKGKFSDNDKAWTASLMQKVKPTFEDDGSFWIEFDDYIKQFTQMIVLRLLTDNIGKKWNKCSISGAWRGATAGGCTNSATWRENTQYAISVKKPNTNVFVVVTQPDTRMVGETVYAIPIGCYILKTKNNSVQKVTYDDSDIISKTSFAPVRETSLEATLQPTEQYVIIPTTFHPNMETNFWMDVYSEDEIELKQVQKFKTVSVSGKWKGESAGGCYNHPTWSKNPIYLVNCKKPVTSVITVNLRQEVSPQNYYIGLYHDKWNEGAISKKGIASRARPCTNAKDISVEITVQKEEWPLFLMPVTFQPNLEGDFKITIFTLEDLEIEVAQ